jgi:hypothetical protein
MDKSTLTRISFPQPVVTLRDDLEVFNGYLIKAKALRLV